MHGGTGSFGLWWSVLRGALERRVLSALAPRAAARPRPTSSLGSLQIATFSLQLRNTLNLKYPLSETEKRPLEIL